MPNPVRQVSDIIQSVAGQITGADLSEVNDVNGALERAARILQQKAKMPETVGRLFFNLYSGVYDYPADQRMFGTSIIDMRPQGVSRNAFDYAYKDNSSDFDRNKRLVRSGYEVTVEYNNGSPFLRVATAKVVEQIPIDNMNQLGTWIAGGSASNLAVDTTVYYQSPAALSFNLANGGTAGYIERTLPNPIDLTAYQNSGVAFLAFDPPTATDITSIEMRLGSDSNNYYDVSNTQGFLGAFQAGQYQLVALDLSKAVKVGNPVITKIQYVRMTANYDGQPLVNVRFGGLWISLPSPVQLIYTTAALFLGFASGILQQKITSTQDYIILSDAAWTLYELEACVQVIGNSGGTLSSSIAADKKAELNGARARNGQVIELGLYDLYRADNPTQEIHTIGNWYNEQDQYGPI